MNFPKKGSNGGSIGNISIKVIYRQSTEPENPKDGYLWIDTSSDIPLIYIYKDGEWVNTPELQQNIWISENEPTIKYNGLVWVKLKQNENNNGYQIDTTSIRYNDSWLPIQERDIFVSSEEPTEKQEGTLWVVTDENDNVIGLKVYHNNEWKDIATGGSGGEDTYQVKATNDDIPGYLIDKVDNETIQVNDDNKLAVKFQDDKTENVVWSSQRVTKEAIIKAIIFG